MGNTFGNAKKKAEEAVSGVETRGKELKARAENMMPTPKTQTGGKKRRRGRKSKKRRKTHRRTTKHRRRTHKRRKRGRR